MVDAMVEWFFENYENPVHSLPYDSAEGGYQYFNGGPYEARDVLYDQFSDASDKDIEKAVSHIESQGSSYWVKIADYNFDEDDESYEDDENYEDDGLEDGNPNNSPF